MSTKGLALNYGVQANDSHQMVLIKRQNKRLKLEKAACMRIANFAIMIAACMFAVVLIIACIAVGKVNNLQNNARQLQSQIDELTEMNMALTAENDKFRVEAENYAESYNQVAESLYEVSALSASLNEENASLVEACQSKDEIISTYEERKELFDRYEYAVLDKSGNRTDIDYEDIKMLEDLTTEKELSEETVDLVLSIAMVESNGKQSAQNVESTATGLGQFLSSTGRFVYEELMDNSNYTHSVIATDSTENLEMMVYYIDYLNETYNGDVDEVINQYRGSYDPSYRAKLNKYLGYSGLSLASIKIS